ncbi:hypothetical protein CRG98_038252, partial [Punica granatum]
DFNRDWIIPRAGKPNERGNSGTNCVEICWPFNVEKICGPPTNLMEVLGFCWAVWGSFGPR